MCGAEVASQRADKAARWLTVTEERLKVADFTEAFMDDNFVLVARYQFSPLPLLNFEAFTAISEHSWTLILGITLMTRAIIHLTEKLIFLCSKFQHWSSNIFICNRTTLSKG